jgi:hypothetical protein
MAGKASMIVATTMTVAMKKGIGVGERVTER